MDLPGTEYGPWEAVGIAVRTQFRAGDNARPGFIVCDLSASPLPARPEIARLIAATPVMFLALHDLALAMNSVLEQPDDEGRRKHARAYLEIARTALALVQSEPPNNPDPPLEAAGSDQARVAA